jgi:uncharacterized protein (DUF1778 family)
MAKKTKKASGQRGRPPLPEDERRSQRWWIRVNPEEVALLDAAAALAGQERSAWSRDVLLQAARRITGKE